MVSSSSWKQRVEHELVREILHPLCRTVQEYGTSLRTATKADQIASLRTQAKLLEKLHNCLQSIPVVENAGEYQRTMVRMTIVEKQNLAKFVALPLRGILQSYHPFSPGRLQSGALQGAIWKVVEHAARAFGVFLSNWWMKLLRPAGDLEANKELLTFVELLIHALPSGPYIKQNTHQKPSPDFDRGGDCVESLLRTILIVLRGLDNQTSCGAIVLLLIDCTITLVEPAASNIEKNLLSASLQQCSLETIDLLIQGSYLEGEDWRKIFPAIYTGLFRCILHSLPRLQTQHQQHDIASASILSLGNLIEKCLQLNQQTPSITVQRQVPTAEWIATANGQGGTNQKDSSNGNLLSSLSNEDRAFVEQIQKRLPNTLHDLKQKLTAVRSIVVRRATAELLRAILSTDHRLWDTAFVRDCWESILVLSQDDDTALQMLAASCLAEGDIWSSLSKASWIEPRILELLQGIKDAAQLGKQAELEQTLKLLRGYFGAIHNRPDQHRFFQEFLSSQETMSTLRESLGRIYKVKFNIPQRAVMISDITMLHKAYISFPASVTDLASVNLQTIASILGTKRTCVLIDSCVASMYKSAKDRECRGVSFTGQSQLQWLQEWIGTPIVICDLLKGLSGSKKVVLRLFRSILPLLMADSLWNLPVHAVRDPPLQPPPVRGINKTFVLLEHEDFPTESPKEAYHGNAAFRCFLMECIGSFIRFLGQKCQSVSVTISPAVFDLVSRNPSREISNTALLLLDIIAMDGSGLASASQFADAVMTSTLLPAIRGRIRLFGTGGKGYDVSRLLQAVESAATVLQLSTDWVAENKHAQSANTQGVQSIVTDLGFVFDSLSEKDNADGKVAMKFLVLFRCSVLYSRQSRQFLLGEDATVSECSAYQSDEPWFALLDNFRTDNYQTASAFDSCVERDTKEDVVDELECDSKFVSQIAWRCCYLLSHSELKVQIQSCEVLTMAMEYLGWIATLHNAKSDRSNGPKTSVLRLIASCWPTLSKKLENCRAATTTSVSCADLLVVEDGLGGDEQQTDMASHYKVLMARLFDLICTMTSVSGDFMASRLKEVVMPCAKTVMRKFGEISNNNRSRLDLDLLSSTIHCLRAMFSDPTIGLSSQLDLMPSVAIVMVPLLGDSNETVVAETLSALKAITSNDGDSLYYHLLIVSGGKLPKPPLSFLVPLDQTPSDNNQRNRRMQIAAEKLLVFLDQQPEQVAW